MIILHNIFVGYMFLGFKSLKPEKTFILNAEADENQWH